MVAALTALLPAALGSTVTVFGVPLATATGLTVAGSIANLAGSLLLSTAANALLAPDVPNTRPENVQTNSKTATGPRVRHYGTVKVGGNIVFHRAADGISYRVVVHGHGEISEVLGYYLNNESVTLDGSGYVTDDQYQHGGCSRVQILSRLGLVPETHYSEITSEWAEWTSSHRLDGQWTSLIMCESVPARNFRGMYPADEPALFALAETSKLYDPRDETTVFSENLALAIADFIGSEDGFNRSAAIDWDNIADEADLSDEQVALSGGGTEARYKISGSYGLNESPQDVLQRMLRAGGGEIRLAPSGKVRLELAQARTAEFTVEYRHLLEVSNIDAGPDGLDRYNVLPGRFVSHDLGYIEVDAEAWRDEDRITRDGGELVAQSSYSALMSPSHRQTRAAMKVEMERANPTQRLQIVCKPSAYPAVYESVIELDVPELGITGKFEVQSHGVQFERGHMKAVSLELHKIDDAAFSLALDEQGTVQQAPAADSPSGIPAPTSVTASGAGVQVAQNTFAAGIGVAWAAPPSDALSPVLRYSVANADEWQDVAVGDGLTNHTIAGLVDGDDYDIALAWMTPGGVVGPETIIEDVTATAASDPPAAPTGLAVTDNADGTATVSMTSSTSADLWQTEVYRDAVLIATFYVGMVGPDTAFDFVDNSGAGTFDWTARSVNVSNINSTSDAGPVNATIA